MKKRITGTHHIALKCADEAQYRTAVHFYTETLGMEIVRCWGEGASSAMMVSTGNSLMEIFAYGAVSGSTGSVNHFALATEDVDDCIAAVRAEGYKVTMEPTDITIASAIPLPARIAFCVGPIGEEIEFFCEK